MPSRLIDIPCDDIFKNDKLGLEPAIASRTSALLSRSPQAIAIDGRWGTGKSTFLALWAAYLRGDGVKVVEFNPWKSFEADPFEALTKQILRQVEIPSGEQNKSHKRILALLKHAPTLAQNGAKLISILQPDLQGLMEPIGAVVESAQSASRSGSAEGSEPRIESPEAFASLLTAAAKSWSDRPIVVMVDELDRCSPDYAVEVLQLLEHVFHTEHVVFVVAVNQSELVHSIRSFYGEGFNAEGHLERFFDDVLPLPASKRVEYIRSALNSIGAATEDALLFLEASGLSLREIDKAIQNLGSILGGESRVSNALIDLWIVRTLVPVEYRQFMVGQISDKALADAVFSKGACAGLRTEGQQRGNRSAQRLEQTLIRCSCVLPRGSVPDYYEGALTKSELYRYHKQIVDNELADGDEPPSYSRNVVDHSSRLSEGLSMQGDIYGIGVAASLLDKESQPQ